MQSEEDEVDVEEQVPNIITDEYLNSALQKAENHIKELRGQEQYQLANKFLNLVKVLENVHFQLKNEEKKAQYLLNQHVDATGRIEEAMKISQRDHDTIHKLKEEVKTAWNEADASKLREQHTNESLNVTRERYSTMMEKLKKLSPSVDSDELGSHKETILQQCERLVVEVDELNKRLLVQRAYSEELQTKLEDSLEKNRELFRQWDSATNESLSNKKKIEKLQKSFEDLNDDYDRATESLIHYKEISELRHNRLMQRESQLTESYKKLEAFRSDNSALNAIKSDLELTLKSYKNDIVNFKHDMNRFQAYVRLKEDENRKLVSAKEQEAKKVASLVRKISSVEKIVSRQEQDIILKKSEISTAENELNLIKKSSDGLKREKEKFMLKVEQLMREIDRLNGTINTVKNEKEKLEEQILLTTNDLKASVEREKKTSSNVKKLQANIETVESEKLFLNETNKQLTEEITMQKKQYESIKLELSESNEQVAHFKHEYSLSLKRLKDARSDFQRCHEKESDVKDRMMKYKSQVDDVSDKLTAKLTEIVSLMKKIKRLEKKNREIKRDYERSEDAIRLCRSRVKNLAHENKLLKDELRENHSRCVKMKSQSDKILRERDLIANQMYRKNDENSLLEDQVSMLKMSIERGNSQYNERLEDIRVMKIEIQSLRSQCKVLKRGLQNTTDMRHEVLQLHRILNQERTKAKVLEEEMTTPMNVHRWRKLKHCDPSRMELIKKCQRLQRSCLQQARKNAKAEEFIAALQEKVSCLEKSLQKRPSSKVSEKLMLTRSKLQENTKRMKAALAITRATESDLNLKDSAINQLVKELNELKSQLFKEKSINRKLLKKLKENSANSSDEKEEVVLKLDNLGNAFKRELLT